MKQFTEKRNMRELFILIQMIQFVAFLFLDLTGGSVTLSCRIKYSIIIVCFCYVLFYKKGAGNGILFCLRTALFFTAVSDLFILILDYYFYGVLTFILVQQLYGIRNSIALRNTSGKDKDTSIGRSFLLRIIIQITAAAAVCFFLVRMGVKPEKLLMVSIFYFICILTNAVMAIKAAVSEKGRNNLLFAAGMVLFVLCDINVGLFNISGFIAMPEKLYSILYALSSILMWTFYAPSQVLIALSCDYKSGKIDKN